MRKKRSERERVVSEKEWGGRKRKREREREKNWGGKKGEKTHRSLISYNILYCSMI